jgi:hypothetical protein
MTDETKYQVNAGQLPSEVQAEYEGLTKMIADKDVADQERQELIKKLEDLVLTHII